MSVTIPLERPASIEPVGIVGFGHFGRALADLVAGAGIEVQAWDPNVAVPPDLAAPTLEALAGHAATLIVATPVRSIRDTVRTLRPLLGDHHLVMDVGSVKVEPDRWMAEELGTEFAWVGTHPLFGPTNIARGERPLRAVVCPNSIHPDATLRARLLYEAIGCRVITQAADDHDRLMARTHAIAFFVAKGLIDVGTQDDVPFTPPSFQALAQTIDSVRSDAGHLYVAIERDNPFAADARQALLDALTRVHALLETMDEEAPAEGARRALAIPDLGDQAPELMETRDLIDEVDAEIIRLLVRRSHLARRAGRIKSATGRGVRDRAREQELLEQRMAWAGDQGLAEEAVADVFGAILRFSRTIQSE